MQRKNNPSFASKEGRILFAQLSVPMQTAIRMNPIFANIIDDHTAYRAILPFVSCDTDGSELNTFFNACLHAVQGRNRDSKAVALCE